MKVSSCVCCCLCACAYWYSLCVWPCDVHVCVCSLLEADDISYCQCTQRCRSQSLCFWAVCFGYIRVCVCVEFRTFEDNKIIISVTECEDKIIVISEPLST